MAVTPSATLLGDAPSGLPPALSARLRHCTTLPSPPGVALRLIELGQDPEVGTAELADILAKDPALTAKLLRIANSPLYAQRRRTENLRQAITLLGLDGTLTLALSFSLVQSLRGGESQGLDHGWYWQRSLATALGCRALGPHLGITDGEELFLAGMVHDIGMLALDRVAPSLYGPIAGGRTDHETLRAHERATINTDHAAVGSWLLARWRLPLHLAAAVAASHGDEGSAGGDRARALGRCLRLGSELAEHCLRPGTARDDGAPAVLPGGAGPPDPQAVQSVLIQVRGELRETAGMFDIELDDALLADELLQEAQELLVQRSLRTAGEAQALRETARTLEVRSRRLEEVSRRDGLTGLFNRPHLDALLAREFQQACAYHWPLSIAFADLDHFKRVNDTFGHQCGDEVLRVAAELFIRTTRDSDLVARYGGEEFVVLMPGTTAAGALVTAQRMVAAFQGHGFEAGNAGRIRVNLSVGVATLDERHSFAAPETLLHAADRALYAAKQRGRNRAVAHESLATGSPRGHAPPA